MIGFRQFKVRERLVCRDAMNRAVRQWFFENGFLEVATPVRVAEPAPEDHIDPVASEDLFLQTSPELCMKRLLAAGYGNIYQIATCFRSRERGSRHLPEMTLLEWYRPNAGYLEIMEDCESLLRAVALSMGFTGPEISYQGRGIDLSLPWERITVEAAFERYAGIRMVDAIRTHRFDEIMGIDIEPRLGLERPCFLMDYPIAMAALSRPKPEDPDLAERFELYVAGLELANAFTELTDPEEQARRFHATLAFREAQGKPVLPVPERFLAALPEMPPSAGIALGMDRLAMLFTDSPAIDDVTAFVPEELGAIA